MTADSLDVVRTRLSDLDDHPVAVHVTVIGQALDSLVGELDELARTIPPAR